MGYEIKTEFEFIDNRGYFKVYATGFDGEVVAVVQDEHLSDAMKKIARILRDKHSNDVNQDLGVENE